MTASSGWPSLLKTAWSRFGASARNSGGGEAISPMNQDFVDLLRSFVAHDVRFLVVGAYALAEFGSPMQGLTEADFARPGIVFQLGLPPGRIDVITELTGLTFAAAWPDRVQQPLEKMRIPVIGREAFIRNKKATGRAKDLVDIEDMD